MQKYFFNFIYTLTFLFYFPYLLWCLIGKKKYRKSFFFRLGLKKETVQRKKTHCLWLHAVSYGELKAARSFLELFKENYSDWDIVISMATESGHDLAIKEYPFAQPCYLPFDFSFLQKERLLAIKPDLIVVCENDLWPNLLIQASTFHIPVLSISTKLSDKSFLWYRRLPSLCSRWLHLVTAFCCQTKEDAQKLQALGIDPLTISVTGNLKWVSSIPQLMSESEKKDLREKIGLKPDQKCIVIASTHFPEEKKILNALKPLSKKYSFLVLLAPRHLERIVSLKQELAALGYSFVFWKDLPHFLKPCELIIADEMGLLKSWFQIADIGIVGGSFTLEGVGGHNILEPAFAGAVPVFGPFMHSQKELEEVLLTQNAGLQSSIENLSTTVEKLLIDERVFQGYLTRALNLKNTYKNVALTTFKTVETFIKKIK